MERYLYVSQEPSIPPPPSQEEGKQGVSTITYIHILHRQSETHFTSSFKLIISRELHSPYILNKPQISFAQTIFANRLRPELDIWAPEVDANAVMAVGATKFKEIVPFESIAGVIMAYNESLTVTFVS